MQNLTFVILLTSKLNIMKHIFYTSLICLMFSLSSMAGNYNVTNTNDSGTGSLREAVTSSSSAYGPDNIIFNIPLTDAGYNSTTGVWTITLLTPLPYVMGGYTHIDGSTQTVNQGNTNPYGPEIMIKCDTMLDYSFILVSPNNFIKGFIFNGFKYGVLLYSNTSTNNTITECYFGTDHTGTQVGIPNQNGISFNNNATNNQIINNLISGNTNAGIVALDAGGNNFRGNKIGTDISGTLPIPNTYGIAFDNSSSNVIGGTGATQRNIISGNSFGGIVINQITSTNNVITANFIGTDITGTHILPNDQGIVLSFANNTIIGGNNPLKRNIISGNTSGGIIMNGTGTRNNIIKGNYIGTDTSGLLPLSNYAGIVMKSKSNSNIIGGSNANERNVISANIEMGIYVEASDSNTILGNYLGPDATGMSAFKIGDTLLQANGIEFNTVSKHNILGGYNAGEGNIISGNRVYGMVYYGNVSYNAVVGNYIGVDASGNNPLPNATGICVDGGSNNNPIINNVLSGNISYGIFIVTTGSYYNVFKGNIVGLNAAGTDTVPNESGLLIGGGTKYNIIGGDAPEDKNVFSGNRFAGIQIVDIGTKYNTIKGNYVGTDISGMIGLPNYYGVCVITNASKNTIDKNFISGNKKFGLLIFENADSNIVTNNKIGIASDLLSQLGNGTAGVVMWGGASNNKIGTMNNGNIIANQDTAGILIMDNTTVCNTFSSNSIYNNTYLGIDIFPEGINPNDAGDADTGPNDLMNHPEIASATFNPQNNYTLVNGLLDTQNPQNCVIELFIAEPNMFNSGDGKTFIGTAIPDSSGNWTFFGPGAHAGDAITATATNACGSTSEFSANFSTITEMNKTINLKSIFNIYPNPANDMLTIQFASDENSEIAVSLLDIFGRKVYNSDFIYSFAGNINQEINVTSLTQGIYFIQISDKNNLLLSQKIIINR